MTDYQERGTGPPRRQRPDTDAGAAGGRCEDQPKRNAEACTSVQQLRRRRAASWRLPLLDCGHADPLDCRHTERPPSEKMFDAGREAAEHLLGHGLTPLLSVETRRALWRRGGDDRALVEELHALTGEVVA